MKDGTPDYAADLKITVAAVAARCCRRLRRCRRRRLPFMIKGAHLSESYLLTLHVMNVLSHDYAKCRKFDILHSSWSLGLHVRL